jgi:hypothetical protein
MMKLWVVPAYGTSYAPVMSFIALHEDSRLRRFQASVRFGGLLGKKKKSPKKLYYAVSVTDGDKSTNCQSYWSVWCVES